MRFRWRSCGLGGGHEVRKGCSLASGGHEVVHVAGGLDLGFHVLTLLVHALCESVVTTSNARRVILIFCNIQHTACRYSERE